MPGDAEDRVGHEADHDNQAREQPRLRRDKGHRDKQEGHDKGKQRRPDDQVEIAEHAPIGLGESPQDRQLADRGCGWRDQAHGLASASSAMRRAARSTFGVSSATKMRFFGSWAVMARGIAERTATVTGRLSLG